MERAALAALAFAAACSGSKPRAVEDARPPPPRSGDAAASDADAPPGEPAPPATGDAQIRVEWVDVPLAARASPGRTACQTPRAPAVAPTTTWGVPEVLVIVDGAAPAAEARVVIAECAASPRLAIGAALTLESGADRPVRVTLARRGTLAGLDALDAPGRGAARPVQLPIAGHAVTVALDAGAIYELALDGKDPETAWIVAGAAAITEPSGQVIVRDLAPGAHAVTAWLPPRAGQPARLARGEVTVTAGDLAELTLTLK